MSVWGRRAPRTGGARCGFASPWQKGERLLAGVSGCRGVRGALLVRPAVPALAGGSQSR